MIRINLLPFRAARKKENIRQQISGFVLFLFLLTGLLYWVGGFWSNKIDDLNMDIQGIQRELTATQTAAKEVDKIKKELDELQKKTEVIGSLKKSRREPVQMLEAMTRLVVEKRMWFTDFSDSDQTVKIKGIALDNKTVADFMTLLEESALFSNVNLDNLKQQTMFENMSLKNFEITCSKAAPETASDNKAASS